MSREKKISRSVWEGFVLATCVRVPKERVPIWRQYEESALLMDLATSGAAQKPKKTHDCSHCEMNHGAVQCSLANDSSESSESNMFVQGLTPCE